MYDIFKKHIIKINPKKISVVTVDPPSDEHKREIMLDIKKYFNDSEV